MFSFFFAFLLYSKILYYSIRNKSRNLVQIFVNFNQLKCKIAQYSIFRLKKQNQNSKFSLNSGSVFENIIFYCATVPSVVCAAGSAGATAEPSAGAVWSAAGCCAAAAAPLFKAASAASSSTSV